MSSGTHNHPHPHPHPHPRSSPSQAGSELPDGHEHVFLGSHHGENARRTLWVVLLTAAMMVVEIVAGLMTGSMALLADGFHMATHAGALGLAAVAYSYARRHARDPRFSFGTGKVGDLAAFASALILGVVALGLAVESIARLFEPSTVNFTDAAIVATLGLGVNLLSAVLLSGGHGHHHGHQHDHHGHHHHGHGSSMDGDNNLRSAYFHVLADALTSVLAIAALLAGRYLGWDWCDPLMGIVGGIVIARWAWELIRETSRVLLDETDEHVADEMRAAVEGPGDAHILDLHVWRVGPQARAAIISVSGEGLTQQMIRSRLAGVDEVEHLTVECR
ncbi:CDF family Co(II)/Ni(II) efflux transporter DmeF [Pararhodobacter sp.]|uniref:CDF family Co(II)/Ni(II) efflux transporter DmeF n=1 Tax=Pararhodobacter sp. TaxID=2127056 RepID=UPI002AFDEEC8|nr:CDF family Co(II)/Ni(II) efflux transporter DmeF [Pararhodobacter sp.]